MNAPYDAGHDRPTRLAGPHLVSLPGTQWRVWRYGILRSPGFPADGLERFASPSCAAAADAYLGGTGTEASFVAELEAAARIVSQEVRGLACDPAFREAMTWQNPDAVATLDLIVKDGAAARPNHKHRRREEFTARYWQRYVAKNETIGFFGPNCWCLIDPQATTRVRPGTGLVQTRRVFLEWWALAALAERLAADREIRIWLPAALQPHLALRGRQVLRPTHPPAPLTAVEEALLAHCDGQRPAIEIARYVCSDPFSGLRAEADALLLLDRLVERGLVRWGIDLPFDLSAEQAMRARLEGIGAPAARKRALSALERLTAARERVASCAGRPEELRAALDSLGQEFVALTGREPRHRPGQMYAGRTLCHEETARDLDVILGQPVLQELAPPIAILLQIARWLSSALAEAYRQAFQRLYHDLASGLGSAEVSFGQFWFLAQGLLFGRAGCPADSVVADFSRRCEVLFGLDQIDAAAHRLSLRSADLKERLARLFPAERPGWSAARIHSPDLQLYAPSVDAIVRGDFSAVLGELHAAWASLDAAAVEIGQDAPEAVRAALQDDLGPGRLLLLYPVDWPRVTARIARWLDNDTDYQLGIGPAPGGRPDRLVPIAAATLSQVNQELFVRFRDNSWPLLDVFGELLATHAVEAFKRISTRQHTPRITVDRMVVARESWRTTGGATELAAAVGRKERYLAVRRWRSLLDLPERVFVKVATESKPCYVDLTSPVFASLLCTLVRSAHASGGRDVPMVVTEMLPTPDQAWVPDASGRRYFSELRLQVCDPEPASVPSMPEVSGARRLPGSMST